MRRGTYDVIIIGGGVIGCSAAYYLSQHPLRLCLLEKNGSIPSVQDSAPAALIHAGFSAPLNSQQAFFQVRGNRMMAQLSREAGFRFDTVGSLTPCYDETDVPRLRELHQRGKKNGVRGLSLLWGEALRHKEPTLPADVYAGLYAPSAGLLSPREMLSALWQRAAQRGCQILLSTEVQRIERPGDHFAVVSSRGTLTSAAVINAAGIEGTSLRYGLALPALPHEPPFPLPETAFFAGTPHHPLLSLPDPNASFRVLLPNGQQYCLQERSDDCLRSPAAGYFEATGSVGTGVTLSGAVGSALCAQIIGYLSQRL